MAKAVLLFFCEFSICNRLLYMKEFSEKFSIKIAILVQKSNFCCIELFEKLLHKPIFIGDETYR